MEAMCDAGCKGSFVITDFITTRLDDGIEKVGFNCTHCNQEYVSFYTDMKIREQQQKIRYYMSKGKDTTELQEVLKEGMTRLREKIQRGSI